ncbi:PspC domain-containing protein [Winogradskyella wichelsiae]|uniref:PspC domain-containing protein n=1 Tax=Winogradskyella wichelsiae TaxID=2697007 RepID=UPI003EF98C42
MNKTVNINLAGIFFHIDEDAYLKLSRYLEAIKRSFTDSQGQSEIISDIEARIAELFSERIQNQKQVVGLKLVDDVIAIMGQPEDYLVDDEIFEDEPQQQSKRKTTATRRFFRDTDNSYIGGVAAGIGHYFGLDALWIRLLWVILFFSFGTGILLYIILWALIPEAKTTAEKLTMTGDAVNISNIEKKIKDGIDTVSENLKNVDLKKHGDKIKEGFDQVSETVKGVDFQKQSSKLKSSSQSFFETIGNIIMFFFKVIAKFIGILLIFIGLSSIIGFIIAFFTIGITNAVHFPGLDFINASNAANIPIWLMSLLVFFAIAIPFFFIFYLGLKILVNNLKSIGNIAKFTLLGIWIMAIVGLVVVGIRQATEQAYDANIVQFDDSLNIKPGDTLKVKMISHDSYNKHLQSNYYNYRISPKDNNSSIISARDIRLTIKSTTDSLAHLKVSAFASGSNYELARKRAENINYNFKTIGNELRLDSYLITEASNKFSDQHIEITLYLPEGTVFSPDNYASRFTRQYNSPNNLLKREMQNNYFKIVEDDVECLDCIKESKIEDAETVEEKMIDTDTELSNINKTTKETSEISIKINDEDGVKIEVNDN